MQNEDHTDIMDELAAMVGSDRNAVQGFINDMVGNTNAPIVVKGNDETTDGDIKQHPNPSMPESTLHRMSKMVMQETVEDKKMDLMWSGTKIPENNVDVLDLIDTSKIYQLINDGINKYNHRNTGHGFINDMVDDTIPTMAHNSNKATYLEQDEINDLNKDLRHLRYGLGDNINDDDKKNSHNNTNLPHNGLKSNNTIGAHIVEEKKDGFMNGLTHMMSGTVITIFLQRRMNQGAHTRLQVITTSLNSPKSSITGNQKQDLLVKYLHL